MGRDIVVTGANGWIGGHVGELLARRGWQVTGVSRTPDVAAARRPDWSWVGTGEDLERAVERIGIVVNLAGRNVLEQPWTPEYVQQMCESRIETTRRIASALGRSRANLRVLVSGSGYPIYGDAGEEPLTDNAPVVRDLVAGALDVDWESAARTAESDGVRVVLLRLGLVLGPDGGAFPALRQSFDSGAGAVLGTGRQWVPWIHIADAARLIIATVDDDGYRGPVNVVAPQPARHTELAAAIAAALGTPDPTILPAEQVTAMLGGVSELLLTSQRAVPALASARGFAFEHVDIGQAVKHIVKSS